MDYIKEVQRICSIAKEEDPHSVAVKKAIPAVGECLRTQTAIIEAGHEALLTRFDCLERGMKETQTAISDFTQGHFSLQFTPRRTRLLPQGFDPHLLQRGSASPSPAGPRRPRSPSLLLPIAPQAVSLAGPARLAPPVIAAAAEAATAQLPSYKLSREVRTIPDLWREWTIGLAGLPSVEELDRRYGSKWRPRGEAQYYSTRKRIIDEIRKRAGRAGDPALAVAQMEAERLTAKVSLDKIQKLLTRAAKGNGGGRL